MSSCLSIHRQTHLSRICYLPPVEQILTICVETPILMFLVFGLLVTDYSFT